MNVHVTYTPLYKKGFMLLESLIAISILLLVSPAFIQYALTFDINRYISSISYAHIQNLYAIDRDIITYPQVQEIDMQSKNCDLFFSSIFQDGGIDIDTIAVDGVPIDFEGVSKDIGDIGEYASTTSDVYGELQFTQDILESTLTSIESFGKTKYGQYTVYIGSNSASTSIADLFAFSYDIDRHELVFRDKYYLGPGIVGMDLYPRIYGMHFRTNQQKSDSFTNPVSSITKYLGVIEKSIVTPFWIMQYRHGDLAPSSTPRIFPLHLNLAGAYPQTIKMYSDWFMIGTQKSLWSELVIGTIETGSEAAQIIEHLEVGAGVHDIALLGDRIIYASPKNPELDSFPIPTEIVKDIYQNGIYSPQFSIDAFDAPGELGNGKSISVHPYGLFLGRTVGNHELYSLISDTRNQSTSVGSITQNSTSTGFDYSYRNPIFANPNISIRRLIYTHDGYGLIALTNSDTDAIKIYVQSKDRGMYQLKELVSLDLPAKPTDAVCIQDQLLLTTESSSIPIVVIYEKSK
ncbi:MAG: hypothetical protein RIQ72_648 [Candidatus Parcubacteria bacterium]|jgi:hypothetical protein